ncbi:MAG TPA: type VI immunity family protein [Kofleriaceae bacterium]
MIAGPALAAALHFDRELASDPAPFSALVRALFGEASPDGTYRHHYIWADQRKAPPSRPLDLHALLALIAKGSLWLAAVETGHDTRDGDAMRIAAGTTPLDKPAHSVTACRYGFDASFGAARLDQLGAQHVLDLVIAFADAVAARAGVVHWADTTTYASCLASCSGGAALSREQSGHVQDLMYWQPRWGDVIRGPQWGTFLGASHVDALGGVERIARDSGCARVIALGSGGAFLQATPLVEPIVEGRDDGGTLARLARFLAPVMGTRT